jgi:hypothetical protein
MRISLIIKGLTALLVVGVLGYGVYLKLERAPIADNSRAGGAGTGAGVGTPETQGAAGLQGKGAAGNAEGQAGGSRGTRGAGQAGESSPTSAEGETPAKNSGAEKGGKLPAVQKGFFARLIDFLGLGEPGKGVKAFFTRVWSGARSLAGLRKSTGEASPPQGKTPSPNTDVGRQQEEMAAQMRKDHEQNLAMQKQIQETIRMNLSIQQGIRDALQNQRQIKELQRARETSR